MLNPYASYLGQRDPVEVIGASPVQLRSLVDAIGPERIGQPRAPGKWSAKEILCHLADCELTFAFRLRQTLAETHHVIQPFDQDRWAETYPSYDVDDALGVFSIVRKWNLKLIRDASSEALSRPVTHPERGAMTFQILVETMAGHDLNHIRQLEAIAGKQVAATE